MARLLALFALLSLLSVASAQPATVSERALAPAAWSPGPGTAPVEELEVDGAPALRLRYSFAPEGYDRAAWDLQLALDLRQATGISFEVFGPQLGPASGFQTYFRTGEGWYSKRWYPSQEGEWERVRLTKQSAAVEGTPGGWGEVTTLRFAIWRGGEGAGEILVRDLRVEGAPRDDARIAVIAGPPDDGATDEPYAPLMYERLRALGFEAAYIDQADLSTARLAPHSLLILPRNGRLSDEQCAVIEAFVARGGRVFAAYSLPARLQAALGLPATTLRRAARPGEFAQLVVDPASLPGAPGSARQNSWNILVPEPTDTIEVLAEWADAEGTPSRIPALLATDRMAWFSHVWLADGGAAKDQLLLALLCRLDPALWRGVAEQAVERAGRLDRWPDYLSAAAELARRGADPTALAGARAELDLAEVALATGDWQRAYEQAGEAALTAQRAWAAAHRPAAGEWRAWWCHQPEGVPGQSWAETARKLAANGFNAVIANLMWGGLTAGQSDLLPVADPDQDQIAEALAACRAAGIELHMWKVNYRLASRAPAEFIEAMRAAGRLQRTRAGVDDAWLCPSHPLNQQFEVDSLVEAARRYDLDGIHFDYIRYPGLNYCYCDGCHARFGADTGDALADWPAAVDAGGRLRQAWLQWRRDCISTVVQQVHDGVQAVRPGTQVSAAVFRNYLSDRDSVGQDWSEWCARGWLDFVCPMDYTASREQFARWTEQQQQWAQGVPLRPGIGASATGLALSPAEVIDQILITREAGTGGFVIFNLAATQQREILPFLGLGVTRPD